MTSSRLSTATICLVLLAAGLSPIRAQNVAEPNAKQADGVFVTKPYLQLGQAPTSGSLVLLWHADDTDADWTVAYRSGGDRPWRKTETPGFRRVAVTGVAPHRVYRARFEGLAPGETFDYKVSKKNREVFLAQGRALKGPDQPYRFVAFGDCGTGSPEQKVVAHRTYRERPDFVMIPGDIVYGRGRASEYQEYFWPVYNADEPSPTVGAPLLRSTLFVAAPGNHDIATRDLQKYPDTMAYYYYWDQPLNGPPADEGSAQVPRLVASDSNRNDFVAAAGAAYPRMANFSFDYGNAHWTVIDSNPYVDWTDPALRSWVARDLAAAQAATWRFVAFHHPGFNSSRAHYEAQQMRQIAGILEAGKTDVVFNGHVHNYQRSYPLRFVPGAHGDDKPVLGKDGKPITEGKLITGRWTLDRSFDGRTKTRAHGVIYLITGAGGQHLYDPEQQAQPESWQEFTQKFHSKTHSLTIADVNGPTLTIRQISLDGAEIDRFVVTK